MKPFSYHQPTDIRFGLGRVGEAGEVVSRFGKRCVLVTGSKANGRGPLYERILSLLKDAGVEAVQFDGVQPNPTTDIVKSGAKTARDFKADVVLGMGGGSAIDTAKAIAVEATHTGPAWDHLWFSKKQPGEKTLPIVAIPTTHGAGSHVTQSAYLTKADEQWKSALSHPSLFPRACIVDPELTLSLSKRVTVVTGWAAFTHAFESYLSTEGSYHTEMLAMKAMRLLATNLQRTMEDPENIELRGRLCWGDTMAGMCVANAGVVLGNAMARAVCGAVPGVSHGEALAAVYPAFTRFTSRSAVDKFAATGRILDTTLNGLNDKAAAAGASDAMDAMMRRVGLTLTLDALNVPESAMGAILSHSTEFPDSEHSPRVPTREEVADLYLQSFKRAGSER